MIRRAGIASAVAAPITVAEKLGGHIVATTARPRSFPPETEERVAGFAELVADALASADAREQLAASRARIVEAGDAAPALGAQPARRRAAARERGARAPRGRVEAGAEPDAARRLLASARAELTQALDELRELARGILAVLSDRGLGAALEALRPGADRRRDHRAAEGPSPRRSRGGRLLPRCGGPDQRC